ncbi:DUF262 domain-containing protein [Aquiflexum gelatinilyticum]|uniref:DUF262 domain-containing protein n=1 Tax=Aquiflexum gelatinilyticum TaxID=2961943 RepID=UPI0021680BB6|nr:DUF262 domain-containing protein [Aquiflexum gelatinilyticum]MCS4432866.1 DUF262 domain-containing protein [Aquiflexum gelatinilyticum]
MKTNSLFQLLKKHKVIIPAIQRDYAQGRTTGKVPRIRERFLKAIYETLTDASKQALDLDFVYGYIRSEKNSNQQEVSYFMPLDGQQRLTTLFLLHWYVAVKEGKLMESKEWLNKFSYSTRKSSRAFCEELVKFNPSLTGNVNIKQLIIEQPKFFSAWNNDPTIASMLEVLNDIHKLFFEVPEVWQKLVGDQPRIRFHLLPMEDLGLPDDLYIKMNSRGKELTDFEHFKSQFSEVLTGEKAEIFNNKIDKEWSDLFWNIFKADTKADLDIAKEVDSGFLSFFWYITDLLIIKNKLDLDDKYWLNVIHEVYQNEESVEFLFKCINLFERLEGKNPIYFENLLYIQEAEFSVKKTRIFFNSPDINLFRKCVRTYGYKDGKTNGFSVAEQLMLYAFIYMSLEKEEVDANKFRLLRNLFASSEDQLRNEYLPTFLYKDVELLIEENKLSAQSKLSKRQLEEEATKTGLTERFPDLKNVIYKLEDHFLLRGNVSIIGISEDMSLNAQKFIEVFQQGCDYAKISLAMLTFGNFAQKYRNYKRFANKSASVWRELFTQSEAREGFENTSAVLSKYLDKKIEDPNMTDEKIVVQYFKAYEELPNKPKDFIYYYIKYDSFRFWKDRQTAGFFHWPDENQPYEVRMLFKTNYRGRSWCPFLLELNHHVLGSQLENFDSDLQVTLGEVILFLRTVNEGFRFKANDDVSNQYLENLIADGKLRPESILQIPQNDEGLDLKDRIQMCREFFRGIWRDVKGN